MKKKKIILLSLISLAIISIIAYGSYSFFKITKKQDDNNIIVINNCLSLTYGDDGNGLSINNASPVSDEYGKRQEPYTFSITNHCDVWTDFQINLETLEHENVKLLVDDDLKYSLSTDDKIVSFGEFDSTNEIDTTIEDATSAHSLYSGKLRPNSTEYYDLRLWMKSTITDLNKTESNYYAKVSVIGSLNNAKKSSNVLMKVPMQMVEIDGEYVTTPLNESIWAYKDSIERVTFLSTEASLPTYTEEFDLSDAQDESVKGYLVDNGTTKELYIQSLNGLNLNSDSSYLFADFTNLKSIEGMKNIFTNNVTNMSHMFDNCKKLETLPLGYFNTSNVTDMSYMFSETGSSNEKFTLNLGNEFDTSNVTNMKGMFANTGLISKHFTLNLGNSFATSNVTNMSHMFDGTGSQSETFTMDLGNNFDTSNVIDMSYMFTKTGYSSKYFTLDFKNKFNTSKVETMSNMFNSCGYSSIDFALILPDNFDTSKVTNMENMFYAVGYNGVTFTLNLGPNFDTSNITNMSGMFKELGKNSAIFELNLGNKFDTSNVTDMSYMFESTGYKNDSFELDLGDKFDTSNVTNMSHMFDKMAYNAINFSLEFTSSFDTSKVTNMQYMFSSMAKEAKNFYLALGPNFDTTNVTDMSYMFSGVGWSAANNFALDFGNEFNTSNVTDMSYMFSSYRKLGNSIEIVLPSKFDTSKVTNMSYMFSNVCSDYSKRCETISIVLPAGFDTSNVTNMSHMFDNFGQGATNSLTLDIGSNFDTSNVTNMSYMFSSIGQNYTGEFTIDLKNKFNTSNVTDMSGMFKSTGYNSYKVTLDLSSFDTSNVTNMSKMFLSTAHDSRYFYLYLGDNFDTSNVTNMSYMFYESSYTYKYYSNVFSLSLGDKFDTSNVTDISYMFSGSGVDVDISSFNFYNVESVYNFAHNAYNVKGNIFINFNELENISSYYLKSMFDFSNSTAKRIKLDYTTETEAAVDDLLNSYSYYEKCGAVKGNLLTTLPPGLYTIEKPSDILTNKTQSPRNKIIYLRTTEENKIVKSFKINGTIVNGNSFIMPKEDVVISDVELIDGAESEHYTYPNNLNDEIYYENTFEGATSITVELTYQIYPFDNLTVYSIENPLGDNYNNNSLTSEIITINGNYLKITITSRFYYHEDYYGFKAIITPNYD